MTDRNPLELIGGALGKKLFEKTRNGLFAMDAYEEARCNGRPIPDWVFSYLDKAARQLREVALKERKGEPIGNPSEQVATAFLMKAGRGKPSPFKNYWGAFNRLIVAELMSDRLAFHCGAGDKPSEAIPKVMADLAGMDVAVSKSTIQRAWRSSPFGRHK